MAELLQPFRFALTAPDAYVDVSTRGFNVRAASLNDLFIDNSGQTFTTDRIGGGLYVLLPDDELLERMEDGRL